LTTAKFYSPEGREISGAGVTPDVNVRPATDDANSADPVLIEAKRQVESKRTKSMSEQFRRTGELLDDENMVAA
jgi:C-terminal processing protease CtpA/Prc